MIGKPRSGKSYCIKSWMYKYGFLQNFFAFGYVASGSLFTGAYDYYNPKWLHDYSEDDLKAYVDKLKAGREKEGKDLKPNFILLDDLQGKLFKLLYSSKGGWFENFIISHRHTNTWVFILSHTVNRGLSSYFRSTINVSLMFRTENTLDVKGLYESFGSKCENYKQFRELFYQAVGEDYSCLAMLGGKRRLEDIFTSYQAEEIPKDVKFVVGEKKEIIQNNDIGNVLNDMRPMKMEQLLQKYSIFLK